MSMNVRNTVLFLVVAAILGVAGSSHAAPPSGGGPSGGPSGGHSGGPSGGHNAGGGPSGGGGHHGLRHGPQRGGNSVTQTNTTNTGGGELVGGGTTFTPYVSTPTTPYPCPTNYYPIIVQGAPFGEHGCRIDPKVVQRLQQTDSPSLDIDYKKENEHLKGKLEYLKANRALLNELEED